jgi:hypothetical protein
MPKIFIKIQDNQNLGELIKSWQRNVSSNIRVAQEEVFGPVAPIVVADSEDRSFKTCKGF